MPPTRVVAQVDTVANGRGPATELPRRRRGYVVRPMRSVNRAGSRRWKTCGDGKTIGGLACDPRRLVLVDPDHPDTLQPAAMPPTGLMFTLATRADGAHSKETEPCLE